MKLTFERTETYPDEFNYDSYSTWRISDEGQKFINDIEDGKYDNRDMFVRDELKFQQYLKEKRQDSKKYTVQDQINYFGALEYLRMNTKNPTLEIFS